MCFEFFEVIRNEIHSARLEDLYRLRVDQMIIWATWYGDKKGKDARK